MIWCCREVSRERSQRWACAEMEGNAAHQVACLAAWQRAGKRYQLKQSAGIQCSRREAAGCSGPWPMSKWRCSVYCKEGSCQLCLLPSQQDGANPHHPLPQTHPDTSRFSTQEGRAQEYFWGWSALVLGPAAGLIDRLSTGGVEFPSGAKLPVALHQRVNAFLTRSWTDHLYRWEPASQSSSDQNQPDSFLSHSEQIQIFRLKTFI